MGVYRAGATLCQAGRVAKERGLQAAERSTGLRFRLFLRAHLLPASAA